MTSTEILQIITGFLGSLAFALLFNIRGKKLVFAGLGGFLSWTLFVVLRFLTESEPIRYFLVAVLISVYAEILARLLKTPTTTFVISSLIPLIPGGSLYYTMAALVKGASGGFFERAIYTLELTVALALGIVLSGAAARMFVTVKFRRSQK
jgi:uncharacterized membrane protein YjjB (DUF3815 family)